MTDTSTQLNRDCLAPSLDRAALRGRLDRDSGVPGLHRRLLLGQPHLFAPVAVFAARSTLDRMRALICAVERVAGLAAYAEEALRGAPSIARCDFGPRGVFFGYDFHLGAEGPALIEINTNAGGAFLNVVLAGSQRPGCEEIARRSEVGAEGATIERALVAMFEDEWRRQRTGAPLRTIAIVDERPEEQTLHADFLLCQGLLRRAGYDTRILAPEALIERGGALFDGETAIDLVYNRLTDFYLERASSGALRRAYLAGGVVVTPHPRAHALYADKRRLALLSDPAWLGAHGVPAEVSAALLGGIPRTELLDAGSRDRLFLERHSLFFKPAVGHGSQAVRRGADLDEVTWDAMCDGEHVAQRLVPPSERAVAVEGVVLPFKIDLRAYAYAVEVQLVAARLYRGVTTNLRTPSGGFSPVYVEGEPVDGQPPRCGQTCTYRSV